MTDAQLAAPALVFAPHFDDETLGCGGTIIRKVRAGAGVRLVFLTDGSDSHNTFIPAAELSAIRRREGLAAAERLGVPAESVDMLDRPDGRLDAADPGNVEAAGKLLRIHRPQQVFVPYHRDPTPDHVATHAIVTQALGRYASPVMLLEYPVWFWRHWPWAQMRHLRESGLTALRRSFAAARRLLNECCCSVQIAGVAADKREALDKHSTQMSRFNNNPDWPTLTDVWDGDFIASFFRSHEIFAGGPVTSRIEATPAVSRTLSGICTHE